MCVLKCNILQWLWHGPFKWLEKVCNKQTDMTSTRVIPKSLGNCHPWLHRLAKAVFGSSGWVNGSSHRGVTAIRNEQGSDLWSQYQFVQEMHNKLAIPVASLATPAAKKHTGPKCEAAAAAAAIWFQHSHSNIWMQKGCCGPPEPENGVPYWTTCESPGAKTAQRPKWAG